MSVNPGLPVHRLVKRERANDARRAEVMMCRAKARADRKTENKTAKGPRGSYGRNILCTTRTPPPRCIYWPDREWQYHATKGWRSYRVSA